VRDVKEIRESATDRADPFPRFGRLGLLVKSESSSLALKNKNGQPGVARWAKIYYGYVKIRGLLASGGTVALP
jgi:hypothetical protein